MHSVVIGHEVRDLIWRRERLDYVRFFVFTRSRPFAEKGPRNYVADDRGTRAVIGEFITEQRVISAAFTHLVEIMPYEFKENMRSAQRSQGDLASFVGGNPEPCGIEGQQACEESEQCISNLDFRKEPTHPMSPRLINRILLLPGVFLGFFGGFWLQVVGGMRTVHSQPYGKWIARSGIIMCWSSLIALLGFWGI